MAVFYENVGSGALLNESFISFPAPLDLFWFHNSKGSEVAAITAVTYWVYNASLSDLTRRAWYGTTEMTPLGIKPWSTGSAHGWTEMFGLMNPPKGTQIMHAQIAGLPFVGKIARCNSVTYTGVDSFGTVITASGSSSGTLTVTGNGSSATRIVAAFGTNATGLSSFTQSQRYLSNTAMSLLIGDAAGTGSDVSFSTTRTNAGAWGSLAVVLNPADITANATGTIAAPILTATGRRYPRPGTNRRTIFAAEPEN